MAALIKNTRNKLLAESSLRILGTGVTITSTNVSSLTVPVSATVPVPTAFTLDAISTGFLQPVYSWKYKFNSQTTWIALPNTTSSLPITLDSTWLTAAGTDTIIQYSVTVTEGSTAYSSTIPPASFTLYLPILRDGKKGSNTVLLTLFKRTTTSTPPSVSYTSANSTYSYINGTITGQPDGWTLTAPTNVTDPYLWAIQLSIASALDSYTFSNTLWPTTPVLYTKSGSDGPFIEISGLTTIYKNSGGALSPATVYLAAIVYNIDTPTFSWTVTGATPTTGTGSSITITPTGTSPVTVTLTTSGTNLASSITISRTMAVVDQGTPGQAGANGVMSAYPSIYRWVAGTTAPTRPTTTSTYTWSTGAYTAPSSWSTVAPSNTSSNYTLWEITVPLAVPATTTTSTLDWTNTTYTIRAIAYNGSNGYDGANGLDGSAMYLIDRGASSTNTAPTSTEVYNKLGRYAIAGDIATTLYSSATGSKTWQATTSGATATWSLITTYLSGSLIVQDTITGDKLSANTITASKLSSSSSVGSDGTFSLDTSSIPVAGKYATGQFYTSSTTKFGLSGLSTSSSSTAGGILGGGYSSGMGISAFNAKTSAFSTFNTACSLGTNVTAGYYKFHRSAGDQLAIPNTEVNVATSGDGIQGNYYSESGSYQRLSFYLNNNVTMYAGIFRYHNTSGTIITEASLGGSTYAVNVPTGKGSSYFGGVVVPFTAAHDGLISDYAAVVPGDIIVDMEVLKHIDISNSIVRMEASIEPNQKGVVGVCNEIFAEPPQDWQPSAPVQDYVYAMDEDISARPKPSTYDNAGYFPIPEGMRVLHVNAIGEGLINVCGEGGNIEKGDLIVTSSIPGKGMRQADDIVRNITVAKARETVQFEYSTQVKQIACIYMCG